LNHNSGPDASLHRLLFEFLVYVNDDQIIDNHETDEMLVVKINSDAGQNDGNENVSFSKDHTETEDENDTKENTTCIKSKDRIQNLERSLRTQLGREITIERALNWLGNDMNSFGAYDTGGLLNMLKTYSSIYVTELDRDIGMFIY
jgi:hypothetical protein